MSGIVSGRVSGIVSGRANLIRSFGKVIARESDRVAEWSRLSLKTTRT